MTTPTHVSSPSPHVITLGTAGGPVWATPETLAKTGGTSRAGISTALVIGDDVYLIDAGHGTGRQLALAGIGMDRLRAVFLTHLHSDHTVDLPSLVTFGAYGFGPEPTRTVPILGPGPRGILPEVSPRAVSERVLVAPSEPTPGTARMIELITAAYATDLNDRVRDGLRAHPSEYFHAMDIEIPEVGYHANLAPAPSMDPFEIYRDENVVVTATLVFHEPMAPAFAFRFDTAQGSVTISGDTGPTANLERLAAGSDLLLHEAIDGAWLRENYGDDIDALPSYAQAGLDHHRRSHTTAEQVAELAQRAGVGRLALHHLVPSAISAERWLAAAVGFDGQVLVPDDLTLIPLDPAAPEQSLTTAGDVVSAASTGGM